MDSNNKRSSSDISISNAESKSIFQYECERLEKEQQKAAPVNDANRRDHKKEKRINY